MPVSAVNKNSSEGYSICWPVLAHLHSSVTLCLVERRAFDKLNPLPTNLYWKPISVSYFSLFTFYSMFATWKCEHSHSHYEYYRDNILIRNVSTSSAKQFSLSIFNFVVWQRHIMLYVVSMRFPLDQSLEHFNPNFIFNFIFLLQKLVDNLFPLRESSAVPISVNSGDIGVLEK